MGDPPPAAVAVPDKLDEFAHMANEADPMRALMLLFWRYRHQDPAFTVEITAADLTAFEQCINYLEIKPEIRIFRPQGAPAHPGAPATETRSAIPPRPAGKPKDYVVIQMVDQEGNAIVPVENNEADLDKGKQAQAARRIKETAGALASQMIADLQAHTVSSSTIMEAAQALQVLARA